MNCAMRAVCRTPTQARQTDKTSLTGGNLLDYGRRTSTPDVKTIGGSIMRKVALLVAAAATAATLLPATSASADVGGKCNGVVDANCWYYDWYGDSVYCTL